MLAQFLARAVPGQGGVAAGVATVAGWAFVACTSALILLLLGLAVARAWPRRTTRRGRALFAATLLGLLMEVGRILHTGTCPGRVCYVVEPALCPECGVVADLCPDCGIAIAVVELAVVTTTAALLLVWANRQRAA